MGYEEAIIQAKLTEEERNALPGLRSEIETARAQLVEVEKKIEKCNTALKQLKGKKLAAQEKDWKKTLKKERAELEKDRKTLKAKIEACHTIYAKEAIEKDITKSLPDKTVDDWFKDIATDNLTFLDMPIIKSGGKVPGIHKELAARLKLAEDDLMAKLRCASKAECANKLGLYSIKGLRPPKSATGGSMVSMHCYGLAIDVNYEGNPFVGNAGKKSVKVIENATLLVLGQKISLNKPPEELLKIYDKLANDGKIKTTKNQSAVQTARTISTTQACQNHGCCRVWEVLHIASEALKTYFALRDNKLLMAECVNELQRTGDKRDESDWRGRIKKDFNELWNEKKNEGRGDFKGHKNPATNGFMDLDKRLVEALVVIAGLKWGGQYNKAKDIMHFDWRKSKLEREAIVGGE